MASTTFSKPVDTEIKDLNRNLTNYTIRQDLTSGTTWGATTFGLLYKYGKVLYCQFAISSLNLPADDWVTIATLPNTLASGYEGFFSCCDYNNKGYIGRITGARLVQLLSKEAITAREIRGQFTLLTST